MLLMGGSVDEGIEKTEWSEMRNRMSKVKINEETRDDATRDASGKEDGSKSGIYIIPPSMIIRVAIYFPSVAVWIRRIECHVHSTRSMAMKP
jgi:hypothetical protein